MTKTEYVAHSVDELTTIAPQILSDLGSTKVVVLDAPMGAGKTTLVCAIVAALGSDSIVNSPTFAIVNDYELPDGDSVFHFDLYRLRSAGELQDIGCDEYFYSGCYCFVEWPELAADLLPEDTKQISISVAADDSRIIRLTDFLKLK